MLFALLASWPLCLIARVFISHYFGREEAK